MAINDDLPGGTMNTLPEMADKISFATDERQDGSTYDVARLWIGGVLFSADLMPQVEAITRRIAEKAGLEIIDNRRAAGRAAQFLRSN